jgi:hypothetical protein
MQQEKQKIEEEKLSPSVKGAAREECACLDCIQSRKCEKKNLIMPSGGCRLAIDYESSYRLRENLEKSSF